MPTDRANKAFTVLPGLIMLGAALVMVLMGNVTWGGLFVTLSLAMIAIGSRGHEKLKGFSFTLWVFTAVAAAMFFPQYVGQIGGRSTQPWIVPLIQITMFGMGTALSLSALAAV